MADDRWQRVADLYQLAQDRAPEERLAFVRQASGADSGLRREVESLLAQDQTNVAIDQPIGAAAHSLLADNAGVQPGSFIGPYRIDNLLGAGGMGEVYRARDTKLNRDVAIKILPSAFANDPDRLARFKREAQVLASLNHPNIATIHGFEDSSGVHALVLELVEGPTLADRLQKGRLEIDEAIAVAKQIAEALEAAHEQGIIHRDLKPGNIKIRDDGTVKVLDFGLAKLVEPPDVVRAFRPAGEGGPEGPHYASQSPTITTPAMTAAGMILGTAAYMSPEQAKGRPADKRSDIWAFGCVLYEMLTGTRAFDGEDVSDTLANILKSEPDWQRLPASTSPAVRRLLLRCLQKDRKRRLADVADARLELEQLDTLPISGDLHPLRAIAWRERSFWAVGMALALVAVAFVWRTVPAPRASREVRFDVETGATTELQSLALSPDGSRIVFVDTSNGERRLWLRAFDSPAVRMLEHTEDARYPFWSPDGRSVAFFATGLLKKIDLQSGAIQTLAPAPRGLGGSWNREGVILFAPTIAGGLRQLKASGGTPVPVTTPPSDRVKHVSPQFLPDGRHFIYYVDGDKSESGEYVGQLDSTESTRILSDIDAAASFMGGDYLLFPRRFALLAQRFDLNQLKAVGDIAQIAETVRTDGPLRTTALTASSDGSFAYRRSSLIAVGDRLSWFDRSGQEIERLDSIEPAATNNFSLSPTGDRVAFGRGARSPFDRDGVRGIWFLETARRTITPSGRPGNFPLLSPDGKRFVYAAAKGSSILDLFLAELSGGHDDATLLETPQSKQPNDWSPNGEYLAYRSSDPQTGFDLWILTVDGNRKSVPFLRTPADEREAQFSPDGRWIAYESNKSGRPEIYVQPFGRSGDPETVSTNGGTQVRWRRDGRELFYVGMDGELMSVQVKGSSDPDRLPIDSPMRLFPSHVVIGGPPGQQYIPSADGQRFLVNVAPERALEPISVVLNWRGLPPSGDAR